MDYQLSTWHKAYIAAACGLTMWLTSQAPVGKFGKGVFLSLSLLHSIALVRIAKPLIREEAYTIAQSVMSQELKNTELVLQTTQIEGELHQLYATEPSSEPGYNPEIIDELRESLEALWHTVATETSSEVTGSGNRKNLYLAIVNLLEIGQTETFIIKEIFQCRGRRYQEGKDFLEELLREGRENEW